MDIFESIFEKMHEYGETHNGKSPSFLFLGRTRLLEVKQSRIGDFKRFVQYDIRDPSVTPETICGMKYRQSNIHDEIRV